MKSRKNLWQYTVILSILNIFFITAQTSHNQNIYADFNFSRNDTTHDKWTKSIEIIESTGNESSICLLLATTHDRTTQ